MRYYAILAAFFVGLSSFAQAATLNESDIPGGFSSDFRSPTQVSSGFDVVTGDLAVGDYNLFSFTELAPGAQTVSMTFSLQTPPPGSSFQNAGGYVRFQETPFANSPEEGARTNFGLVFDPFNTASNVLSQTLSFNLDDSFSGTPLFFSVRTTFSSQGPLSFSITAPGNMVAPVPLPAAGLLLLTGLAGGVALRRRKKPQAQYA